MADIWRALQNWIDQNGLRIDRPKGSSHQRFPNLVYPLDYGFIQTTTASDGGGVDVFVGTLGEHKITGLLATFDPGKGDAEIKVLYDCTPDETQLVTGWLNQIVTVVTLPNEPEGISRLRDCGQVQVGTEAWDVLGVDGQPTGRVVTRNVDGGDPESNLEPGERHRIVIACVFGPDGQLMIQQRTSAKVDWPNLWDLTGGSALKGETSQQAVSRELSEEVGLHLDFSDQPPHVSLTTPTAFIDIFLANVPRVDLAKLVLQEEEVQAVRWATLPEILNMIDDGTFCPYHPSLIQLIFDVRHRPGELSTSYFSWAAAA